MNLRLKKKKTKNYILKHGNIMGMEHRYPMYEFSIDTLFKLLNNRENYSI